MAVVKSRVFQPTSKVRHPKKLSSNKNEFSSDVDSINIISDVNILFRELKKCLCYICGSTVNIRLDKIVGLGCKVNIVCHKCENTVSMRLKKKEN